MILYLNQCIIVSTISFLFQAIKDKINDTETYYWMICIISREILVIIVNNSRDKGFTVPLFNWSTLVL